MLLGPEERHGVEPLARTEHVAGGGLTLPLGNDPMLDADRLAGQPVRPSRYVAGGPYTRNVCLEIRVDSDAAVTAMPEWSASAVSGRTPMPTTTESAASRSPLRKLTPLRSNEMGIEVEGDAVLLVDLTHEVSDLLAEHGLHRESFGPDDMHLQPPFAQ